MFIPAETLDSLDAVLERLLSASSGLAMPILVAALVSDAMPVSESTGTTLFA